MLRSMYSAISGMNAFQTQLDVIGNNIANVNTTGYKTARTDFADVLSQTQSAGSAPALNPGSNTYVSGGTNPNQVGLGVKVSATQTLFTQGADQSTGVPTDLAINGGGLFTVSRAGQTYYTRAGDFSVDKSGNLVLPNGAIAQGVYGQTAPVNGTINSANLHNVNLGKMVASYATAQGGYSTGTQYPQYTLASSPDVQIGADGSINATVDSQATAGAPVTQQRVTLGYMALGTVSNPSGLSKMGDSLYAISNNSGNPTFHTPGTGNTGQVESGYLEMSNVDLTRQLTNMITAQQAFSANSKVIGTDTLILNDLSNLRHP
ncbi:flagellar hook-basal body complex protein [Alicyclobacillus sp. SO9]|uniref:flagellar hook-basal body complex protein n=1 Tax=Alicyclobacillus sp. SO9 TaxID=2665646 RepID=UPI0018E82683|nr:flagellar hook-basal body complex protein [Alicyclobacillus sp. SO9]QQE80811.1 flagellar hook-basal body complex protein [Alicyclobacillus sp. SO9]